MMTDDELDAIEHRLELFLAGDPQAIHLPVDVADLLTDARLTREQLKHLRAELRSALHIGPR